MRVAVDAYAGWRADERPRSVRLPGKTIVIEDILDMRIVVNRSAPDDVRREFTFRGDDGVIRTIFLKEHSGDWYLTD